MLALLSPAKKLNFETPGNSIEGNHPLFIKEAYELASSLRDLSLPNLKSIMPISDNLLKINMERYKNFKENPEPQFVRNALYAFSGDTYVGLNSSSFSNEDISFADQNLRIISGLYGLLKPTDLIQPYRLEMGTRLKNRKGSNLYDFWKSNIANEINRLLPEHQEQTLVNLASKEYFNAIDQTKIKAKVIDAEFLEEKNGTSKVISFFSKKARGAMANFIVKNKITITKDLQNFDLNGYRFNQELSSNRKYVYSRSL